PEQLARVYIVVPGILEKLHVKDGQSVLKGDVLAEFRNLDLETQLEEARTQYDINNEQMRSMIRQASVGNLEQAERSKLESKIAEARGERDRYDKLIQAYEKNLEELRLVAPQDGIVMTPPKVDDVGKYDEKEQQPTPFCGIGQPRQLRALMPVAPSEYRLLQEDLKEVRDAGGDLAVTLRVQGRDEMTWQGRIEHLPESEAKDIPVQLTNKGGGNIAVKPSARPNVYTPQSQQYLVAVEFLEPDSAICPGTMAQVKVHCKNRTCAWWAWRAFSSAFDLGMEPTDFLPRFLRPSS